MTSIKQEGKIFISCLNINALGQIKMTKCLLLRQNISPFGENPESGWNFCFSSEKTERVKKKKLRKEKKNYRNDKYALPTAHAE